MNKSLVGDRGSRSWVPAERFYKIKPLLRSPVNPPYCSLSVAWEEEVDHLRVRVIKDLRQVETMCVPVLLGVRSLLWTTLERMEE